MRGEGRLAVAPHAPTSRIRNKAGAGYGPQPLDHPVSAFHRMEQYVPLLVR